MSLPAPQSWGRYPETRCTVIRPCDRNLPLPAPGEPETSMLPFGNGRSYGDSCLNDGGILIDCRGLNRIIGFNERTGVLRCEAGILFSDILAFCLPRGWFLPVTPGTQYVTLGGAIANDIHGKNHHRAGTFGRHVRQFELLRSDGSRRICSPQQHRQMFSATVGGLGLTGLITWAEIQLSAVPGDAIDQEVIRFASLDEFFALSAASGAEWEHTVAWIDSLAGGGKLGRGLFVRGNHAASRTPVAQPSPPPLDLPFDPPFALVNRTTLKAFNALYYRRQLGRHSRRLVPYPTFFYPLDRIGKWYRLYGPKGLLQHQSVIPHEHGADAVRTLLETSAASGTGSFLTVLKEFGDLKSPGLLSFPRPGVTLTLDFPNQGPPTLELLDRLDQIVIEAGGAINPYKDARMSRQAFRHSFPQWRELEGFMDPNFSSSFWRRVCGEGDQELSRS